MNEPQPTTAPEPAPAAGASAFRTSTALRALFLVVAILSVAWLFLTWRLVSHSYRQRSGLTQFSATQESYHATSMKASRLLKRGSDTLTEMARRYVVTGNREHLDAFLAEADSTRSRNHALELVDDVSRDVSPETRAVLHKAMDRSNALFALECHAMHLRAKAKGVSEEDIPKRIREERLTDEERALGSDALRDRAVELLFDDAYFASKTEVWDLVNEFLDRSTEEQLRLLQEEAADALRESAKQPRIITVRLIILFLLLVLSLAAVIAIIAGKNRTNLRLMDELRRERDATVAAEKAKSLFFSVVSHDIRTPLNSIIGFSEMLVKGVDDPKERATDAENVLFSARTLLALVNDVLDLSKLDAEKMTISPAPCDFATLISRVADSFRIQTEAKGITMRADAAAVPRVVVDEDRVRQILVNLAGNAVKFTKKGGVEIHADFAPDPGGGTGTLRFSVRDTGIGIAPEDHARVFDPFVQVGPIGIGGTGLGLTICNRLLQRMGGALSLESEPGKGSVFTATLPGIAIAPAAEEPSGTPTDSAPAPKTAAPRIRSILVVDDVPVNLLVEKAMLRKAGVERVETAASADAALAALRGASEPFDLVLTDLWMPDKDGYALCEAIRADPALAAQRVCALTADVEARKTVLSRGFDAILLKPLTAAVLESFLSSEPGNVRPVC